MFLLKSWMSPSNCMIYLSAQVKRFWNVVKWRSRFLVFANPAMSILINELEKLCFFFLFSFIIYFIFFLFQGIGSQSHLLFSCNLHLLSWGMCRLLSFPQICRQDITSMLSLCSTAAQSDPGQLEYTVWSCFPRQNQGVANNSPITLGHSGWGDPHT